MIKVSHIACCSAVAVAITFVVMGATILISKMMDGIRGERCLRRWEKHRKERKAMEKYVSELNARGMNTVGGFISSDLLAELVKDVEREEAEGANEYDEILATYHVKNEARKAAEAAGHNVVGTFTDDEMKALRRNSALNQMVYDIKYKDSNECG